MRLGAESVLSHVSKNVRNILDKALTFGGHVVDVNDGAILLKARGKDLRAVAHTADVLRQKSVGDRVTYAVNRNINFTNTCVKKCGFCAFSRVGNSSEAYYLPTDEVVRRVHEAHHQFGATEVCVQAGLPPNMSGDLYPNLAKSIKEAVPSIHLHAFSPEEVVYGAERSKCSIKDYIAILKDAGVDSLPGTSCEILDDNVRNYIAKGRLSTQKWIEVITEAHKSDLNTTSTIMFGHVETEEHRAAHIDRIRQIQKETGGFTEFVPLSFVSSDAPMWKSNKNLTNDEINALTDRGLVPMRAGPTGNEVIAMTAVSRIMLDGSIDNIQASWVKEGLRMSQTLLDCGANDLGGTLMNESISTSAGAQHGQLVSPLTLRTLIRDSNRIPAQRTTTYKILKEYSDSVVEHEEEYDPRAVSLEGLHDRESAEKTFGSFKKLIGSDSYRFRSQHSRSGGIRSSPSIRQYSTTTLLSAPAPVVTYSKSFTIVPTRECFNNCDYCTFRTKPSLTGANDWLTARDAQTLLDNAKMKGQEFKEVLILSGEVSPRSKRRSEWFNRIVDICEVALSSGYHPHTNIGPISVQEMERLKECNVSMGLMLEQLTPSTLKVHRKAPSKVPSLRVQQIEQAGMMGVPYTTGILLGIGETEHDRIESLKIIAQLAHKYGHIQEVIIQPYSAAKGTRHTGDSFSLTDLPNIVKLARDILPPEVVVQVPPNLVKSPGVLLKCLENGAKDLGGISPVDEVNREYSFPMIDELNAILGDKYMLQERLAVHDRLIHWLPKHIQDHIAKTRNASTTTAALCESAGKKALSAAL